MSDNTTSRSVILANNVIKNYGRREFRKLLNDFINNVDGITIAARMGVTRQRVHQWRQAFTKREVLLVKEVEELLSAEA